MMLIMVLNDNGADNGANNGADNGSDNGADTGADADASTGPLSNEVILLSVTCARLSVVTDVRKIWRMVMLNCAQRVLHYAIPKDVQMH